MKKALILSVIVFALAFSTAMAADSGATKTECDNVISANVWPYLGAFFNLGYERDLFANISVRVRGEYWGISSGGFNLGGYGVDLFYHPMGKGLDGWYFGPRFDQWILAYSGDGTTGSGSLYWVGAQVGYRWIFDGGFEMAVSLGGQSNIAASITYNNSSANATPPFKGLFLPTFDYDLGYAF